VAKFLSTEGHRAADAALPAGDGVPEFIRNDANLSYSWNYAPTSSAITNDYVYVKWTGTYTPSATHPRISTCSDDGVGVTASRPGCTTVVINNWGVHAPQWDQSAASPMCGAAFVAGTTAFADKNLASGTTYYYKIAALDHAGNQSVVSTQIAVTTP